jgi:hypothetical protein
VNREEWARSQGLTESQARRRSLPCLHWLVVGRCAVARCSGLRNDQRRISDWLDHVTCWVRPGYRLILSQPYPMSSRTLGQLIECERLGNEMAPTGRVHARVGGLGDWYGNGTVSVGLYWVES